MPHTKLECGNSLNSLMKKAFKKISHQNDMENVKFGGKIAFL